MVGEAFSDRLEDYVHYGDPNQLGYEEWLRLDGFGQAKG